MSYIQINQQNEFLKYLPNSPVIWDANNYCTPEALVKDGKAAQFRVVELRETDPPNHNPETQVAFRDGCEFVNGEWQYKWGVRNLTLEEIEANRKAKVPQVVSRRQAKQALLQAGLLDTVDAAIAASSDRSAQIDWADAQEFRRDWPALIALQPALGLTDAQIDDLFLLAATL